MSIPLLTALAEYYNLVETAASDSTVVVPSELDFTPGPGGDLESMIWVLTYAMMIRYQEGLQGFKKTNYKLKVVDQFYGSLSYSGLALLREAMVFRGINPLSRGLEEWIPDPAQCKWFRRAMTLVGGQLMPSFDGSIRVITFDAFDALCDEFITDE
jgi:hypothetical protein